MKFSSEDFAIILALNRDPFISTAELASQLNISEEILYLKISQMKTEGVLIRPVAMYEPEPFGLSRINILALVPNIAAIEAVEKLCDEHPYTHYRARMFGGTIGLFMQFDIPEDTLELLELLFSELKNLGLISKYSFYQSTGTRLSADPDLSRYNFKLSSWRFNWNIWFATLQPNPPLLPVNNLSSIDYTNFDPTRLKILRMLTSDASITPETLTAVFDISLSSATSHLKFVMEKYVSDVRYLYNREIFDLSETIIAFGHNVDPQRVAKLYYGIKNTPPPFYSAFDVLKDNNLCFWATMSPGQIADFTFAGWQNIPNFKTHILDIRSSMLYWFYPPNFNLEKRTWKDSNSYIVKNPLLALQNFLSIQD